MKSPFAVRSTDLQAQFHSRSKRWQRWVFVASSLSIVSIGSLGCQNLGFRTGLGGALVEDDWELSPSATGSQVPRPYIESKKNKPTTSSVRASMNDAGGPVAANQEGAKPPQKLDALTPAESSPSKKSSPNVVETGVDDLDIEAAIQDLPTAYRDILKRQLVASKQFRNKGPQSSDSTSTSQQQSDLGSEVTLASANVPTQPANQAHSAAQNSSSTAPEQKPRSRVSFHLSDNDSSATPEAAAVVPASASSASSNQTQVVPATLTGLPVASPNPGPTAGLPQPGSTIPASSLPGLPTTSNSQTQLPVPSTSLTPLPSKNAGDQASLANQASSTNWHQSISVAIAAMEKQLAEQPGSDENLRLHQELTLRMLYAALRKPEEAMQPIKGLADDENEYYRNQMLALIEASNPDAMPVRSRHLSLVMNSQRKATGHLAAASNLEVRSVSFCTDVERYGVYTKFPKYQFKPDEEVLLYCELENVAATQVRDGYESQLQGSYEILDSQGNRVIEQTLPMEPDVCQNLRRDYYMVYRIYMPQQIAPGNYKLRLTVEDLKARKYGQSTLDLQIKKQ